MENIYIVKGENQVSVCLSINDYTLSVGEKLEEINEYAYMNGYNWEAILNCYLEKNHPKLLENLDSDPEADMYVAYYDLNEENLKKAKELKKLITELLEYPDDLYEFVEQYGDEIEWD